MSADGHRIPTLTRLAVDPDQLQFRRIASRVITPPPSGVYRLWSRVARERFTCAMTPTHPRTATYHRVPGATPQKPLHAPYTRHHGNPDPKPGKPPGTAYNPSTLRPSGKPLHAPRTPAGAGTGHDIGQGPGKPLRAAYGAGFVVLATGPCCRGQQYGSPTLISGGIPAATPIV